MTLIVKPCQHWDTAHFKSVLPFYFFCYLWTACIYRGSRLFFLKYKRSIWDRAKLDPLRVDCAPWFWGVYCVPKFGQCVSIETLTNFISNAHQISKSRIWDTIRYGSVLLVDITRYIRDLSRNWGLFCNGNSLGIWDLQIILKKSSKNFVIKKSLCISLSCC